MQAHQDGALTALAPLRATHAFDPIGLGVVAASGPALIFISKVAALIGHDAHRGVHFPANGFVTHRALGATGAAVPPRADRLAMEAHQVGALAGLAPFRATRAFDPVGLGVVAASGPALIFISTVAALERDANGFVYFRATRGFVTHWTLGASGAALSRFCEGFGPARAPELPATAEIAPLRPTLAFDPLGLIVAAVFSHARVSVSDVSASFGVGDADRVVLSRANPGSIAPLWALRAHCAASANRNEGQCPAQALDVGWAIGDGAGRRGRGRSPGAAGAALAVRCNRRCPAQALYDRARGDVAGRGGRGRHRVRRPMRQGDGGKENSKAAAAHCSRCHRFMASRRSIAIWILQKKLSQSKPLRVGNLMQVLASISL